MTVETLVQTIEPESTLDCETRAIPAIVLYSTHPAFTQCRQQYHDVRGALAECLAAFIMSEPGACPECGGYRAHAGLCRIRWPKMDQEHAK